MATLYKILIAIIILAVLAYGIRRRYRRSIGMQRFLLIRMVPLTVISPFAVVISELGLFASGKAFLAILGIVGIGVGVGLGIYNGQHTRFEQRGKRTYYQSHAIIGYSLFGVLLAQLLVEIIIISLGIRPHWHEIRQQLHTLPAASQEDPFTVVRVALDHPSLDHLHHIFDPLTRIIVGLLAGYYFVYHIYLLVAVWRKEH